MSTMRASFAENQVYKSDTLIKLKLGVGCF